MKRKGVKRVTCNGEKNKKKQETKACNVERVTCNGEKETRYKKQTN